MIAQQTTASQEAEKFSDFVKKIQLIKDEIGSKATTPTDKARAMAFELAVDAAIRTGSVEEIKSTVKRYGISL